MMELDKKNETKIISDMVKISAGLAKRLHIIARRYISTVSPVTEEQKHVFGFYTTHTILQ